MKKNNVSLIVAIDEQSRGIGYNNELVWHCADDMKWFKEFTSEKSVIMGRKTFESLNMPYGLPSRINYVLTNDWKNKKSTDTVRYIPLDLMLKYIDQYEKLEEFVVIGGSEIYELMMPYVSVAYVTEISKELIKENQSFDSYFPILNEDFKLVRIQDKSYCVVKQYERT